MNVEVALEFVDLALSLVKSLTGGATDSLMPDILFEIAQKAAQAYHDHMGEPIDPALLTFEAPI